MQRSPRTVVIAVAAFALALGGGIALLQNSSPTSVKGGSGKGAGNGSPSNSIWQPGTAWTVSVRQDSGAITPDGAKSVAAVPFRFRVTDPPVSSAGEWKVHVTQDGAEGPFAGGWDLYYREADGAMVLHRVAVGAEKPLEAELAAIVLGPQFPYEVRYEAAPKDFTVDAEKLLDRSLTPPSSLPTDAGGAAGATPPAQAPKLSAGGEPDAGAH